MGKKSLLHGKEEVTQNSQSRAVYTYLSFIRQPNTPSLGKGSGRSEYHSKLSVFMVSSKKSLPYTGNSTEKRYSDQFYMLSMLAGC